MHSVVVPDVKVTVPVAPAGSPKAETVSVEPYTIVAGDASLGERNTSSLVTVKVAPLTSSSRCSCCHPEYVALTGYVPGASVVAVRQLVAGRVATQRRCATRREGHRAGRVAGKSG